MGGGELLAIARWRPIGASLEVVRRPLPSTTLGEPSGERLEPLGHLHQRRLIGLVPDQRMRQIAHRSASPHPKRGVIGLACVARAVARAAARAVARAGADGIGHEWRSYAPGCRGDAPTRVETHRPVLRPTDRCSELPTGAQNYQPGRRLTDSGSNSPTGAQVHRPWCRPSDVTPTVRRVARCA